MNSKNFWLFGNNPKTKGAWDQDNDITTWDGTEIEFNDEEDYVECKSGFTNYYVSTNINNIQAGDIAFFWSFPNFAITTVGYIVSSPYTSEGSFWCDMFICQIEKEQWISGSYLSELRDWKNRKPFTYKENGEIYSQFANPKKMTIGEYETIFSELSEDVAEFITNGDAHDIFMQLYTAFIEEE